MKVVILAAGKGTRLQEVESGVPKPMVVVGGKPVLDHTVEWLAACGITDITITVGHLGYLIMRYFGNGEKWGVQIVYSIETTPLGTAGGVKQAVEGIGETFAVWHGDNLSTCDLQRMLKFHRRTRADGTIAVCWREDATPSSIVEWKQDTRITEFTEKPQRRVPHGWISAGMYILEPQLVTDLPNTGDFGRDVFPCWLTEDRQLHAYGFSHDEWLRWYDTPEDLRRLREDYP